MPLKVPAKSFFLSQQRKTIKTLHKQGRLSDAKNFYSTYKSEGGKLTYKRITKGSK
jgi:hypothetical protein